MNRFARSAWNRAQGFAVAALCLAAPMALPLVLAGVGFHIA